MLEEQRPPAVCLDRRRAGVLLHLTSLPGEGPCGDLGPEARHFVHFLADCGMTVWQMLPVGPTQADGSPYQTRSAHAGSPRLISLDLLRQRGWLKAAAGSEGDSELAKEQALRASWAGFQAHASDDEHLDLERFSAEQSHWLEDYVLFLALHQELARPWSDWPMPLRVCESQALAVARRRLGGELRYLRYQQYLFFSQWADLKEYANRRGIRLFGDMPIFVAHDSAEVWARPEDFDLLPDGSPRVVAGVPPDYFSATGQRWGNPLYRWERMAAEGFGFWVERLRTQLRLFDLIRIDHFRGFESCWEIPAADDHAMNGQWVQAPGDALFECLHRRFPNLPLIAEDLGVITEAVESLRKKYQLPGMKVLQFAFSGDPDNPYLPHHHSRDAVVYTGTHDNDTTLGWYQGLDESMRAEVDDFLGHSLESMPWPLIRCALASRAHLAIIPMQDLLGLDGGHRMNTPGTAEGNWGWRFAWSQVPGELARRVRRQVRQYGRMAPC